MLLRCAGEDAYDAQHGLRPPNSACGNERGGEKKPGARPGFGRAAMPASFLGVEAFLPGEVGGEIVDVALGEVGRLPLHDRVLAMAVLVVVQRGDEVVLVLAGEVGEFRAHADALRAIARLARGGFLHAGLGVAGSGERGDRCAGERGGEEALRGAPHFSPPAAGGLFSADLPSCAAKCSASCFMSSSERSSAIACMVPKSRSPLLYSLSAFTMYAAFWPPSLGTW